ncbi:hypothetical protein [Hyunsoonleella aestuarii]|uniref:Lipoprotein n=1 Tax=Hyunsoonleella aestuarii TaxID=912802 RepID=A0ABP8E9J0_9FLAO|nr:hypothetical protein [Hyunsoonleella aestuarii]
MKKSIIISTIAIVGLLSCKRANKSTPDLVDTTKLESTHSVKNQKLETVNYTKFIDTEYEYAETGKKLIIRNGLPKGGMKYTDPNGENYNYRIFWTQIINETDNSFELSIEIPSSSFELQSSPTDYFKIFLPKEEMNIDKMSLSDYGLSDLEAVLDSIFLKQVSLQKTINTKETSFFYIVALFSEGYEGVVRAGLNLRDGKLFYRVNDVEISSGKINTKNLKLQN